MRLRCITCQGTYATTQADGTSYFHVCPPEWTVTVVRRGHKRQVPFLAIASTDVVTIQRQGKLQQIAAIGLLESDEFVDVQSRPRQHARNENTKRFDGTTRVILAEGQGVEPLTDDQTLEE